MTNPFSGAAEGLLRTVAWWANTVLITCWPEPDAPAAQQLLDREAEEEVSELACDCRLSDNLGDLDEHSAVCSAWDERREPAWNTGQYDPELDTPGWARIDREFLQYFCDVLCRQNHLIEDIRNILTSAAPARCKPVDAAADGPASCEHSAAPEAGHPSHARYFETVPPSDREKLLASAAVALESWADARPCLWPDHVRGLAAGLDKLSGARK